MKNICYINAGAGSGKTFRLTELLSHALLTEGIKPSEVILTTFTELAAKECKEKARKAVLEAKNGDSAQRLLLATELDAAAIGTVHSVALSFLQRYWYTLNFGANIQVMSDNNQAIYQNQSLADVLTVDDIALFDKYERSFGGKANEETKHWQEDLNKIIEKMNYYQITDLTASREASLNILQTLFLGKVWNEEDKKIYDALLNKKIIYLQQTDNKRNREKIETIRTHPDYAQNYNHYIALVSIFENTTKSFLQTLTDEERTYWDAFHTYAKSPSYLTTLSTFIERLFNVAERWNQQFTQFKAQHHMLSYNDLELNFLYLLEHNEEVRSEIQHRYKLLMVDEFQDSNPIQLKIFNVLSELIAANGGKTVWVGDPKQAIYGFRGADTSLVTSIAQAFDHADENDGLTTDKLGESWRSREPLVEVVNHVFNRIFTPEEFPNRDHISLQPHFKADVEGDLSANALMEWQLTDKNASLRAQALAYQVEKLLASGIKVKPKNREEAARAITYKDIAILADRNDEANAIAQSLRQRGLPVACAEQEIMQRKEVKLVTTLLSYFIEPYNAHLRADLSYLLEGTSTEDLLNDRLAYLGTLDADAKDEWKKNEPFLQPIDELRKRIYRLSVAEIVTALIQELNLYEVVGRWGETNIRHQSLNTLIGMAQSYTEACQQMGLGATLYGYLNYLYTTLPEAVKDNTSNSIKVFTYHGSKGLEWPVVILYSLERKIDDVQNILKKSVFGVHEQPVAQAESNPLHRKYYIHYLPQLVGNKNNLPTSVVESLINLPLYTQTRTKILSERKRLLYVGMTRARDYLITASQQGKPLCWLSDLGIDTHQPANCWGVDGYESEKPLLSTSDIPVEETGVSQPTYAYQEKPKDRTLREDKYLSPSKLPAEEDSTATIQLEDHVSPVISRSQWLDMATIGTCIHNIFAIYQPGSAQNETNALRIISQFGLSNLLADLVSEILQAIGGLYQYLETHYGKAESIDRELPFYHAKDRHIMHGEMDMVWNYRKEGKPCAVLVDYKTFPGAHNQLIERTQAYVPQLRAYKEALQAGGRIVTDCLIFYAVQGSVAKVK